MKRSAVPVAMQALDQEILYNLMHKLSPVLCIKAEATMRGHI